MLKVLARPMLSAVFMTSAWETLKDPAPLAKHAEPMIERYRKLLPDWVPEWVPTDAKTLVRVDAGVKLGCSVLLAAGRMPKLAAFVLAADLVPTTLVGHRIWESGDPEERTHFLKNVAVLGGLLATI
ncbi:DoxX family protein [Kutzneria kofuensis]|uniref:Putative membrane protein YphA (DoxX/SURF4 family) n=1 Tax=Kutzneria kofuensis TaxID=103725 RepID=A0A7W9NE70_9PSEU|nr:DoxX family membrane protein [Kutzneria kofuensis]MBB5889104.1 putative membrane protein YphA (DoxX/SURF4 family) [Kutzneria kofuensis]